jgi:hypothetical protein
MKTNLKTFFSFSVFLSILLILGGCALKSGKESQRSESESLAGDQKFGKPVFENSEHDFGRIQPGEEVGARFSFENQGEGPLIIERVSTGCGCTVAEYSKEPVAPGESGFVEIIFDSRGKHGAQFQQANVHFQGLKKSSRLSIVAQVVKK